MSFLKPKAAKSSSENVNNGLITSTYGGQANTGTQANNYMASLLGIPGSAETGGAAQAGYQNYLQNAGYAPAMRQLSQGITGQGAAAGLLNSGTTANRLVTRGTELNQGFFNNYLQQLQGINANGLQAGGLIANTGQKSQSTGGGPSTFGSIASTAGGIASIFSDRRLKKDIVRVGTEPDGLGLYLYRYKWEFFSPLREGVMADEVARIRPWALGRTVAGFQTVNYGAL